MKYLIKKIIQGKTYYYLDYRLTRNSNGKKILISKYIGPEPPGDQKEILIELMHNVGRKAIDYTDIKRRSPFAEHSIRNIENSRFRYHRLYTEPFQKEYIRFRKYFMVLFILNSNRAEGSKVVREDIETIMERKKKARSEIELEINNSIHAISYAFSRDMKWSGPGIKTVHDLLFDELQPKIAGKYKLVNNIAGEGFDPIVSQTSNWKDVPKHMSNLMKWYHKKRKEKVYPPWLAIEFYWRFERIHPFEDGNGRVGRILMNSILQSNGYMPVIFNASRNKNHSTVIGKAIMGNIRPLASFFGDQVNWTIEELENYRRKVETLTWRRQIPPWWRTHRNRIVYDDFGLP